MHIRVVAPGLPAVSLAKAKAHLRVEHDLEDALIEGYAAAAQAYVERRCDRALTLQILRLSLPGFPANRRALRLPRPPLDELLAVNYVDPGGQAAALALGGLATAKSDVVPACLSPLSGDWPACADRPDAVTIDYRAGAEAAAVPPSLLHAMLLLVGHWYATREAAVVGTITADVPLGVAALLAPYQVVSV